jgi:hypothetical protein
MKDIELVRVSYTECFKTETWLLEMKQIFVCFIGIAYPSKKLYL